MRRRERGWGFCPDCGAEFGTFSQQTCPCAWSRGGRPEPEHEEPPEDGGEQAPADVSPTLRRLASRPYRSEAQARAEREARR